MTPVGAMLQCVAAFRQALCNLAILDCANEEGSQHLDSGGEYRRPLATRERISMDQQSSSSGRIASRSDLVGTTCCCLGAPLRGAGRPPPPPRAPSPLPSSAPPSFSPSRPSPRPPSGLSPPPLRRCPDPLSHTPPPPPLFPPPLPFPAPPPAPAPPAFRPSPPALPPLRREAAAAPYPSLQRRGLTPIPTKTAPLTRCAGDRRIVARGRHITLTVADYK